MSVRDKYNKGTNEVPPKKSAADSLLMPQNAEAQRSLNTEIQKPVKKATFIMDLELHKELKKTAATLDRTMAELVEESLKLYFEQMK